MKVISARTSVFILCSLLCFSALTGCSGRNDSGSQTGVSGGSGDAASATETAKVRPPHHKPADHQILVMLGPAYASRTAILSGLTDEYGLVDTGGMMRVLSWPDSFMIDKRPRLSVLSNTAKDEKNTIVVTVGAPEGTVYELERIRRARPDMKIISLFPEDDMLPLEAMSNLVVEQIVSANVLTAETSLTGGAVSDADLGVFILAAALSAEGKDSVASYLSVLNSSLDAARNLMKQKKSCADWKVAFFVDPDTGLRSQNHLTLEVPAKDLVAGTPVAVPAPTGGKKS